MPMGRLAGIARGVVGLPPHKQEGFRAHPDPGPATAHRLLIQRVEGLEALDHAQRAEIGGPLRRAGLRQPMVQTFGVCSYDPHVPLSSAIPAPPPLRRQA